MSQRKGNQYESELAAYLAKDLSLVIARTPLSGGGLGDLQMADLYGTPDLWVEAKRTERLAIYPALSQAEKGIAARDNQDMPAVMSRKNRMATDESIVTMRLKDWIKLYKAYLREENYL